MPLATARRDALLATLPLFRTLDAEGMAVVSAAAVEVEFAADRVIARQGEVGSGLFILAEGTVRVVRDGHTVRRLGPGEFFGELSVLDGEPRNASVVAEVPVTCLALATWDAERILREHPGVALAILREVVARLRATTAELGT
jgi:CRP/FNR family transcriptional regulator, cyclic AMP receptor protein